MTIPVTMHLSVRAYRAIEPQATSRGITAGKFCAQHFEAMIDAATARTGQPVAEVTDLARPALLALRKMVAADAPVETIAERFEIPIGVAKRWRATIAAEVTRAQIAERRAEGARARSAKRAAGTDKKRSWKRLDPEEQAQLQKMLAGGTRPSIAARELGISVGSVANWAKRFADQVQAPVRPNADECHWRCGSRASGIAYMTDEHTYPAPSCGEHGYGFERFSAASAVQVDAQLRSVVASAGA